MEGEVEKNRICVSGSEITHGIKPNGWGLKGGFKRELQLYADNDEEAKAWIAALRAATATPANGKQAEPAPSSVAQKHMTYSAEEMAEIEKRLQQEEHERREMERRLREMQAHEDEAKMLEEKVKKLADDANAAKKHLANAQRNYQNKCALLLQAQRTAEVAARNLADYQAKCQGAQDARKHLMLTSSQQKKIQEAEVEELRLREQRDVAQKQYDAAKLAVQNAEAQHEAALARVAELEIALRTAREEQEKAEVHQDALERDLSLVIGPSVDRLNNDYAESMQRLRELEQDLENARHALQQAEKDLVSSQQLEVEHNTTKIELLKKLASLEEVLTAALQKERLVIAEQERQLQQKELELEEKEKLFNQQMQTSEKTRKAIEDIAKKIAELRALLAEAEQDAEKVAAELQDLELQVQAVNKMIDHLIEKIQQMKVEEAALERRRNAERDEQLEKEKEALLVVEQIKKERAGAEERVNARRQDAAAAHQTAEELARAALAKKQQAQELREAAERARKLAEDAEKEVAAAEEQQRLAELAAGKADNLIPPAVSEKEQLDQVVMVKESAWQRVVEDGDKLRDTLSKEHEEALRLIKEQEDLLAAQEAKLDELNSTVRNEIEARAAKCKERIKQLREQIAQLEKERQGMFVADTGSIQDELDALRAEVERLRELLMQTRVQSAAQERARNAQRDDMRQQITEVDQLIASAVEEVRKMTVIVSQCTAAVQRAEEELEAHRAGVAQKKRELDDTLLLQEQKSKAVAEAIKLTADRRAAVQTAIDQLNTAKDAVDAAELALKTARREMEMMTRLLDQAVLAYDAAHSKVLEERKKWQVQLDLWQKEEEGENVRLQVLIASDARAKEALKEALADKEQAEIALKEATELFQKAQAELQQAQAEASEYHQRQYRDRMASIRLSVHVHEEVVAPPVTDEELNLVDDGAFFHFYERNGLRQVFNLLDTNHDGLEPHELLDLCTAIGGKLNRPFPPEVINKMDKYCSNRHLTLPQFLDFLCIEYFQSGLRERSVVRDIQAVCFEIVSKRALIELADLKALQGSLHFFTQSEVFDLWWLFNCLNIREAEDDHVETYQLTRLCKLLAKELDMRLPAPPSYPELNFWQFLDYLESQFFKGIQRDTGAEDRVAAAINILAETPPPLLLKKGEVAVVQMVEADAPVALPPPARPKPKVSIVDPPDLNESKQYFKYNERNALRAVFAKLDEDNSGTMEEGEIWPLVQFLANLASRAGQPTWSHEELTRKMKQYSRSGSLSFSQFLNFVTLEFFQQLTHERDVIGQIQKICFELLRNDERVSGGPNVPHPIFRVDDVFWVWLAFNKVDRDGSGTVDRTELTRWTATFGQLIDHHEPTEQQFHDFAALFNQDPRYGGSFQADELTFWQFLYFLEHFYFKGVDAVQVREAIRKFDDESPFKYN